VKSIMRPDGVFSSHAGGNVCIPAMEQDAGYPGEPCKFSPRLLSTLKATWKNASTSVVPMPLWQEFHAFVYATDGVAPHRLPGIEVDRRLRNRLVRNGDESHPNLAGQLRYYCGFIHRNMHMIARRYWDFFKKETTVLTPQVLKVMFQDTNTDVQGLSEMRVCHCDPTQCIFHNGLRGPLVEASDVYEVEENPLDLMNGPNGNADL